MTWTKIVFSSGQVITSSFLNGLQDAVIDAQTRASATTVSTVIQAAAVPLAASTSTANVTSISLSAPSYPATYLVWGGVKLHSNTSLTWTIMQAGINTVSATIPLTKSDQSAEISGPSVTSTGNFETLRMGPSQITINAPTTVYLSVSSTYSSGAGSAFGDLTAMRIS